MNPVKRNALWLEFIRIARVDILLLQTDEMFAGLDIPADHWLRLYWLRISDENEIALARFMEDLDTLAIEEAGLKSADWLFDENGTIHPANQSKPDGAA